MSIFGDIEKRIDGQLRKLFASENAAGHGRELIEVQRAILQDLEDRAQMLPRAKRRFPYNDVTIHIAASDPDRKTAIHLVFVEGEALKNEIVRYLREEEIDVPPDLAVSVEAAETLPPEIAAKGFHIVCKVRASQEAAKAIPAAKPTLRFTILHGSAERRSYKIVRTRVHLGRLPEVLDERRRPVRRNDVVFLESPDKPNSTVSRAHAHVDYDAATGEFRLFDDGSTYGTSVVHNGRLVNVPPAGGRGLRIDSGDEIYLGQARLLFEVV